MFDLIYNQIYYVGIQAIRYGKRFFRWLGALLLKPIKFVGVGEKLTDLEPFYPDRMASRILGMGDVLTLIEKAQDQVDQKAAEETAKKMMQNKFDMNDMLEQFRQVKKMGGISSMLSMMPGGASISADDEEKAEKELKRIEAIILDNAESVECPVGENLGRARGCSLDADFARMMVDSWMASAGHRANILNPDFNRIAISIVQEGTDLYVVQHFFS